ncbi:MAG: hypothetical protein LUI87_11935 [Lachnospiraceae bacterium]|nr:hypothetical protein [Lachnospiraceae bacterium]
MPDGNPKNPSKKEIEELKRILENDILKSIEANFKAGNITVDDYNQLGELTNELYMQVLLNYEEKGGDTTVKELLPGAIELPNDVYRIRIDELEEQKSELEAKNIALGARNAALEDKVADLQRRLREAEKKKKQ